MCRCGERRAPANLPDSEVEKLPSDLPTGVYFGWAHLRGATYPMVMSIGWNPYYKNTKKTAVRPWFGCGCTQADRSMAEAYEATLATSRADEQEVHIIEKFDSDFYGEQLAIIILGYLRPMKDYTGVGMTTCTQADRVCRRRPLLTIYGAV